VDRSRLHRERRSAPQEKDEVKLYHAVAIVLVGLSLTFTPHMAREDAAPIIISRVEVRGNHRVSEQAIRQHVSSRAGHPYNAWTVDSDIKAIFHMHRFKRVQAFLVPMGGETILLILVDEKSEADDDS